MEEVNFSCERELQEFISLNCELFFGVKVLYNEYVINFFDSETYQQQTGRIDTLGIDENGAPVIIEYKMDKSSNLINQALYYRDWLINNKRQFELEIQASDISQEIDWNSLRVICIAKNFNKYDYNAIRQIDANVELYKYNKYDELFELLEVYNKQSKIITKKEEKQVNEKDSFSLISELPVEIKDLYEEIKNTYEDYYGEKLVIKYQSKYIAFKVLKNIICIVPQRKGLKIFTDNIKDDKVSNFKNVTDKGHWGTGNYTTIITNKKELKELLEAIKYN